MKKKAKTLLSIFLVTIMSVTLAPESLLNAIGMNTEAKATLTLHNPRIVDDASMKAGQNVTYDCIYFGEYPQTEIVDQASTSGCYGRPWASSTDYEVNAELYEDLQNATFDENGDVTIGSTKYRRLQQSDTVLKNADCTDEMMVSYYNWANGTTYHYFRYDPIKWRVLKVENNQAFLLSDISLVGHQYTMGRSIKWEYSAIRSWLNGYSGSENDEAQDYSSNNFIDVAFNPNEKNAIVNTSLDNSTTGPYSSSRGGSDTIDQIFLLSYYDVYNTNEAKSYGFVADMQTCDESRVRKSSSYAKATGLQSCSSVDQGDTYLGTFDWWLRSPGSGSVGEVGFMGQVQECGNGNRFGCCPALHLDLSSTNLYSFAGIVCSNGIVDVNATPGSIHEHEWGTGNITEQATCTETGTRTYTCTCGKTKTEEISATGHKNTEIRNAKTATCGNEGYSGDTYCKTCGTKISTGTVISKLTTHTWNAGTCIKEPTVLQEGIKLCNCTVCGNVGTQSIPKLTPTIKLSKTKLTLKRKKTTTIKVSNLANGDSVKSWKSTKKKVAVVNSKGKIKAKKKGKTNIIVTLASGKTAVVKVTVK